MARIEQLNVSLRWSVIALASAITVLSAARADAAWPKTGDLLVLTPGTHQQQEPNPNYDPTKCAQQGIPAYCATTIVVTTSSPRLVAVDPATDDRTLIADLGSFTDTAIFANGRPFVPDAVAASRDGIIWVTYRNSNFDYSSQGTCNNGCGGVVVRLNPDGSHQIVPLHWGVFPAGLAPAPDGSVVMVAGPFGYSSGPFVNHQLYRIQATGPTDNSVLGFQVPQTLDNPACASPITIGYGGIDAQGGFGPPGSTGQRYIARDANFNPIPAAAANGISDAPGYPKVQTYLDASGQPAASIDSSGYVVSGIFCDFDHTAFRSGTSVTVDQTTGNIYVGDVEAGKFAAGTTAPYCQQAGSTDCGGIDQVIVSQYLPTPTATSNTLLADFDDPRQAPPPISPLRADAIGEDAGAGIAILGNQFLVTDFTWWVTHNLQNATGPGPDGLTPADPCQRSTAATADCVKGALFLVTPNGAGSSTRTLLSAYGYSSHFGGTQGQNGDARLTRMPVVVTVDGKILIGNCDGSSGLNSADSICQVAAPSDPNAGFRTLWGDFGVKVDPTCVDPSDPTLPTCERYSGVLAMSVVLPIVTKTPANVSVTQSLNPSTYGQSITFNAFVSGSGGTPTGSVTFLDGSTPIGTATLDPTGKASYSTATLPAGTHTIAAAYSGDATFGATVSAPVTQEVDKAATTTTLVTSVNPAAIGQSVTLSVTVLPQFSQTPTGSVTFLDGGVTLGTQTLDPGGQASMTTASLSAGAHAVTALYSGDPNFLASVSPAINQVIGDAADLSVTIVSSPAAPAIGANVTLTIDVHNNGPNAVTSAFVQLALSGTMTFVSANSAAFNTGTQVWSVGTLASGATSEIQVIATINSFAGTATATITSASPPDPALGNNTATVQIQPSGVIYLNGACTLRAAIVAANTDAPFGGCPAGTPGLDVIVLPPNSFHLYGDVYETIDAANGDDALPAVTSPIRIEGQNSVVGRTVNPVAPPPDMRVFYVKKGGSLTLHNVTVRDAHVAGPGAGVLLEGKGASVVIDASNIVNNTSTNDYGGGVASRPSVAFDDGDITIRNGSLIAGNVSTAGGGVLAGANLTIDNSTIGSGTARGIGYGGNIARGNGGGVLLFAAQASITNSTVQANSTSSYGGGVYIYSGQVTITNSTIQTNAAALEGGGAYIFESDAIVQIAGSFLYQNTAGLKGGGLSNDAFLFITNSSFTANRVTGAQGLGGGLVTGRFGTTQMTSSSINSNVAALGGGLWNSRQTTLTDVTVDTNEAWSGGGIVNAGILTMVRCPVYFNATLENAAFDNNGGALLNLPVNDVGLAAALVIRDSLFAANFSAGSGGAIATYGPATLTNVTLAASQGLAGNHAVKAGGGIFVSNSGLAGAAPAAVPSLIMNGGDISYNQADGGWDKDLGGGGLSNGSPATAGGTVALTDVALDHNNAINGFGGGVFNRGPLTVTRGSISFNQAAAAGGMSNGTYNLSGGAVSLDGTRIASNSASGVQAGGILNTQAGTLDARDTVIDGNSSAMFGGNIYNGFASGGVTIHGGSIRNGTSANGGGIYSESGPLTLQDGAVVESNTATDPAGGGGLYLATSAPVRISNTTVRGNNTVTDPLNFAGGAGLAAYGSTDVSIDRTSFVGNHSPQCAAFAIQPNGAVGSHVVVTNTTISGNVAPDRYAALCVGTGSGINLANSTISGNHSPFENIYNAGTTTVDSSTIVDNDGHIASAALGGSFSISNSIVAGNRGSSGSDCYVSPAPPTTTIVSGGYNLFGQADGCPTVATDKTIDPSTLFTAVLAPLADNGGPTLTHALIGGSPAIDTGAPVCPATDQRGLPRPADGNGDDVAGCDIGAYELQSPSAGPPGPATHFFVAAPAGTDAGTPFSFRVTALDAANNIAISYGGTVHFTSTDAAATLPADGTLTNGSSLFSATLRTGGGQTITATDVASGISGTSNSILVTTIHPPAIAKAFTPQAIQVGQISTLTFTISNPNAAAALNDLAFSDPFPVDIFVAAAPNLTNTCGGTVTAAAGTASAALSGGTLATGASCQITVDVIAMAGGPHTNRTSAVTSSNGGTGNVATAELDINAAPSSTTLTVTPVPMVSGYTFTLQAAVTPSSGATATGRVAFLADGVELGRTLLAANEATLTTEFLGLGTHTLTATYLGDGNVASSTSAPVSETVNPAVTSPSLSASPNPTMDYYGGPVVSNVEVRVVFWGAGVDPNVQARIGDFYATVVGSPFMDLLSEYSTAGRVVTAGANIGQPGSNQVIGHGTYAGAVTIAPTVCATPPCVVLNSQIQDEINRQIQNGALPKPTYDLTGHPNTAYMLYFPPGVTITLDRPGDPPGVNSCATFLGYHYTGTTSDGRDLLYGVLPDLGSCNFVPYSEPTTLQDITLISSHELTEIVTDPSVAKAAVAGPPLGWYSQQQSTAHYYGESSDYGEIADVCNQAAGILSGFTVQLVWSNQQNVCAMAGTPRSTVTVGVGTTPGGASFVVDGVTYSTPQTFTWTIGSTHTLDTSSPQATGAGTRLAWTGWSDGQPISHSVTASAGTTTYTATFNTEYQLTTAASPAAGGTVSPSTGQFYAAGSTVDITAAANPGYLFANWTGVVGDTNAASTTVTMSAPQTVTANFSVAPPVLQSIAVTPANPSIAAGAKQGFTATGTYSDSSTKDLTATVTWTSATPAVATITAAGLATGISVGTSTVSATLGGVTGSTVLTVTSAVLQSIAVTPANPSIAAGAKQGFTATGTYSDASTKDVTAAVTWTSATPAVATITAAGLATGISVGTSTVSATLGGITGSTVLTVTSAVLQSIAVTPANPSIAAGAKQGFTATGTYSDASTKDVTATVTWTSATPAVATISAAGVATGISAGTSTVSATLGGVTGSTVLTVTSAVLQSIAVTPANPSVPIGSNQIFTATGAYSDGSTKDVTATVAWTSATPGVATISKAGVATGTAVGTSVIGAAISGVTGSTVLTVTKAATTTVVTSSANPSSVGQSITITATLSGHSPTGTVTFTVDGGAIVIGPVTLNAASASASLSGLTAGSHLIVASYSGDVSNQPSVSTTFTQVVNTGAGKVPTTTTLTSSTAVSTVGQPVTFTVTVSGSAPTGTVTLSDQNSTLAILPLVNGVATFATAGLSKGAHQVTAAYSGDAANLPSTSSKVKQQVQ